MDYEYGTFWASALGVSPLFVATPRPPFEENDKE